MQELLQNWPLAVAFLLGVASMLALVLLYRHRWQRSKRLNKGINGQIFNMIVYTLGKSYQGKGPPISLDGYTTKDGVTEILIKVSLKDADKIKTFLPDYNRELRDIKKELKLSKELVAKLVIQEEDDDRDDRPEVLFKAAT